MTSTKAKPAALPPATVTKSSKITAHAPKPVARPGKVTRNAIQQPAVEPKRGTGYWIRRAVINAFPAEVSAEEIDKQLTAAGFPNTKRSTIITCKQDCVNTLKVAQELGKLKLSNGVAATLAAGGKSAADVPANSEPAAEQTAVQ
jgi:hypothetical protein